ncbi:MAG: hypothetical protein Q7T45_23660 [Bradyrhizobium sp.]|uniref:hypothetical protein n=1 Tax=Bradyrhizobium sp. TaxID=376 RepID=UPI0027250841|nr:hypothetical protein [Bradyrhizobium sp.]MDO8400816.1 hypothetical protein [Bradyrhizobium sp.]
MRIAYEEIWAVVENGHQIGYYGSMITNDTSKETIAEFGRKYLWWEPVGDQPHSEDRIIAQTMNLGTYDDILLLEQTVGRPRLVEIMLHAEPGWINDRSWEFWRGRLSLATGAAIPNGTPRRAFHAAMP